MDVRMFGLENPLLSTLHRLMDTSDEMEKGMGAPTRTYVQGAWAMPSTPADVKELPSAYAFIVDMPGLKPADIKIQVEDDRILVISGERTRGPPGQEDGGKYLRLERRVGKFALPDNANADAISAVC